MIDIFVCQGHFDSTVSLGVKTPLGILELKPIFAVLLDFSYLLVVSLLNDRVLPLNHDRSRPTPPRATPRPGIIAEVPWCCWRGKHRDWAEDEVMLSANGRPLKHLGLLGFGEEKSRKQT